MNDPYDDGLDEYDGEPAPTSNGMATAAMVAGIVGLLLCWVPLIGFIILLVAIVLGVIGLSNNAAKAGVGKGAAVAGVAMGTVGIVLAIVLSLLIAILLPSLSRARTIANRSVSASNMTGVYKSLYTYSVTNKDAFPDQLGILVVDGFIGPNMLVHPSEREKLATFPSDITDIDAINAWIAANSSYVYVYPNDGAAAPANSVIMYERLDLNDGEGVNISYGDGHVSFSNMPTALQTLQDSGIETPPLNELIGR